VEFKIFIRVQEEAIRVHEEFVMQKISFFEPIRKLRDGAARQCFKNFPLRIFSSICV